MSLPKGYVLCSYCGRGLRSGDLPRHIRIHTGEKPFQCKYCQKSFITRSQALRHQRTHSKEKDYIDEKLKCKYCEETFELGKLQAHERSHTKNSETVSVKQFECEKRATVKRFEECENQNAVKRVDCEIIYSDSGEKKFKCNFCEKTYACSVSLKIHQSIHTGEERYTTCSHCGKDVLKHRLYHHIRDHEAKKTFQCKYCQKSFTKKKYLEAHERIHPGEKKFKCKFCEKSCAQIHNLRQHERLHTGERPYKCKECEKAFPSRCGLVQHQRRYHEGETPYKCNDCEKSFRQRSHLIRHQQFHTGKKPFQCAHCEKTFISRASLSNHALTHSGIRSFKCSFCGKSFFQRKSLVKHEFIHTGKKTSLRPFKCAQCEHSFKYEANLVRHALSHTTARGKPFRCNECKFCGKTFSALSKLKIHEHLHKRRYRCKLCEKTFGFQVELVNHVCIHTGEEPYRSNLLVHGLAQKNSGKDEAAILPVANHSESDEQLSIYRTKSGRKVFRSRYCQKPFMGESNSLRHEIIHSVSNKDKIATPPILSICRGSGIDKSEVLCGAEDVFKMQLRNSQGHTKNFECRYCQRTYKKEYNLQIHVHELTVHSESKVRTNVGGEGLAENSSHASSHSHEAIGAAPQPVGLTVKSIHQIAPQLIVVKYERCEVSAFEANSGSVTCNVMPIVQETCVTSVPGPVSPVDQVKVKPEPCDEYAEEQASDNTQPLALPAVEQAIVKKEPCEL